MFHILHDRLETDGLLDLRLCLDIVRIGIESLDFKLLFHLGTVVPLPSLAEELGEASRVRPRGLGDIGLGLSILLGIRVNVNGKT